VFEINHVAAPKHDPEKLALGLDPTGGYRFSVKVMRK